MVLYLLGGTEKIIDNGNDRTYKLLSNIEKKHLDAIRLCIAYMDLKNDVIISDAYDLFDRRLYDHYGIYINPELYDKKIEEFLFTFLKIKERIYGG